MRDVAIVSYAQTPYVRSEATRNEVEMLMPVIAEAREKSGIPKQEIGFTCSGSTAPPRGTGSTFLDWCVNSTLNSRISGSCQPSKVPGKTIACGGESTQGFPDLARHRLSSSP